MKIPVGLLGYPNLDTTMILANENLKIIVIDSSVETSHNLSKTYLAMFYLDFVKLQILNDVYIEWNSKYNGEETA